MGEGGGVGWVLSFTLPERLLYRFMLQLFEMPIHFSGLTLTPSEKVVLDAAQERGGIFKASLHCFRTEDHSGLIVTDGHTAYLLGTIPFTRETLDLLLDLHCHTFLCRAALITDALSKKKFQLLPKDFAFCRETLSDQEISQPQGISIRTAFTEEELNMFHALKAEFIFEESGIRIHENISPRNLREYSSLKPVLLYSDDRAMGMVSSSLHSSQSAMINMLFLKKDARGKGYGSLLLQWYRDYLSKDSSMCCLFYSPDNAGAKSLYQSQHFIKEENWVMGVRK